MSNSGVCNIVDPTIPKWNDKVKEGVDKSNVTLLSLNKLTQTIEILYFFSTMCLQLVLTAFMVQGILAL